MLVGGPRVWGGPLGGEAPGGTGDEKRVPLYDFPTIFQLLLDYVLVHGSSLWFMFHVHVLDFVPWFL